MDVNEALLLPLCELVVDAEGDAERDTLTVGEADKVALDDTLADVELVAEPERDCV